MKQARETLIDKVLEGYSGSYDIKRAQHNSLPLVATAQFHVREAQYALFKSAEMSASHSDEYVYFYSVPHLTKELVETCIQYAYDDGMPRIDLDGKDTHMCTRLVAVFFADSADDAALEEVKKCHIYKSFQFSLKGWMEFHTAAIDFGKESVVSNRYGRETAKYLKSVLHPQKRRKKSNFLSIVKKMLD